MFRTAHPLLAIAAFALSSSLGWANDRPAGIPEEARYAKVDRVITGTPSCLWIVHVSVWRA